MPAQPSLSCGSSQSAENQSGQQRDPRTVASLTSRLAPMIVWGTGVYGVYTYLGTGLVTFGFSQSQVARTVMVYGAGRSPGR